MSLSLILGHDSNLIRNNDSVRQLVRVFAGGLSPVGIVIFSVLKFIGPAVPFDPVLSIIVNSLTQNVVFLSAEVNIVVFAFGLIIVVPFILIILGTFFSE